MEKKVYFVLKVGTENGAEYWSQILLRFEDLSISVSNLLSMDVNIVGIK